ncbi:MAG: LapA family protein [Gracilibacteraceae bacterium]|nr:LapA family protein [Gracilibacteraceae bacterium]
MAGIGLILAIIIALVVVVFTVQNAETVSVNFILWTEEMPLAVVIFCAVFAGALLMFCLVLYKSLKDRWQMRNAGKTEARRQKEEEAARIKEATRPKEPVDADLAAPPDQADAPAE